MIGLVHIPGDWRSGPVPTPDECCAVEAMLALAIVGIDVTLRAAIVRRDFGAVETLRRRKPEPDPTTRSA